MGSIERIHNVAQRVLESVKLGHQVVVVVSAMSGETDRLLEFGKNFSHNPNKREMDRYRQRGGMDFKRGFEHGVREIRA